MALNKRKEGTVVRNAHLNHEGGLSFDIKDPFTVLQISATSCFFGEPAFYVDGESAKATGRAENFGYDYMGGGRYTARENYGPALIETKGKNTRELMESAIDNALNVDIERTLKFAVSLRNDWLMRATPQVIMVRAALHPNVKGTGLIGKYAALIMTRLDEVMSQMAYLESVKGNLKSIPSRLKRAWSARLSNASEYELAKYKMATRSVNIFDAVRLTHPSSEAIDKLIEGKVSLANENSKTWESIRSAGGSWKDAVKVMGHMALLRNLRNLNAEGELNDTILTTLKGGVEKGKQLPFRYYAAFKAVGMKNGRVADALEECLEASVQYTIPRFKGRGLTICDVSGSMDATNVSNKSEMTFKEIAVLMSAITNRTFEKGGDTMLFATNTKFLEPRRKTSIFTEMDNMIKEGDRLGGGTNIVKPFKDIINAKKEYDVIFVYSDMQCGYENDMPKLIKEYRSKVNKNVQVFFVNLAGYQDSLVPEFFAKTYLIGGWSDKVLQFADKIIGLTAD